MCVCGLTGRKNRTRASGVAAMARYHLHPRRSTTAKARRDPNTLPSPQYNCNRSEPKAQLFPGHLTQAPLPHPTSRLVVALILLARLWQVLGCCYGYMVPRCCYGDTPCVCLCVCVCVCVCVFVCVHKSITHSRTIPHMLTSSSTMHTPLAFLGRNSE